MIVGLRKWTKSVDIPYEYSFVVVLIGLAIVYYWMSKAIGFLLLSLVASLDGFGLAIVGVQGVSISMLGWAIVGLILGLTWGWIRGSSKILGRLWIGWVGTLVIGGLLLLTTVVIKSGV